MNRFVTQEPLRLGFIVLSTDLTLEHDLALLHPAQGVNFFVTRTPFHNPISEHSLLNLQQQIQQSLTLLLPDIELDSVAFACTAASAFIGNSRLEALIRQVKPDTKVTNPVAAVLAGLNTLQCKAPAMLAPYNRNVAKSMAKSLSNEGINISHITQLNIEDDRDIARLDSEYIFEQAVKTTPTHCDALFVPCTATPVLCVLARIEEALNIPVLASNQAMVWHSLRLAGFHEPIQNYGRLLQKQLV